MRFITFLISLLLTLFAVSAHATEPAWFSTKEHPYPVVQSYNNKQMGAMGRPYAIVQDKKGYMFVAHDEGVLQFDGEHWRTIELPEGQPARSLAVNGKGVTFVGAEGDLGILQADSSGKLAFKSLITDQSLKENLGTILHTYATDEAVYFVSIDKVLVWDNSDLKPLEGDHKLMRKPAFLLNGDIVLNELNKGLMQNSSSGWVSLDKSVLKNESIAAIIPFGDKGGKLVALKFQGLVLIEQGSITRFQTSVDPYLRNNVIADLISLPNGHVGITTFRGGLVVLDQKGSPVWVINKSSGLPDNAISGITIDQQQGVWVTTDNGIARLSLYSPTSIYGEGSDLRGNVLHITRQANKLFVVTRQGIYFLRPFDYRQIEDPYFSFHDSFGEVEGFYTEFRDVLATEDNLVIATADGIYELSEGYPRKVLPDNTFALHRSPTNPNMIFAGTRNGIRVLAKDPETGNWATSYGGFGLPYSITDILQDGTDLWLSSNTNGILKVTLSMTDNSITDMEVYGFEGFTDKMPISIQSIGDQVVFSNRSGIYVFDREKNGFEKNETLFGENFYNANRTIIDIKALGNGEWLVITDDGTSIVQNDNGKFTWQPEALDKYGVRSFRTSYIDKDIIWLGGSKGLMLIDKKALLDDKHKVQVHINSVTTTENRSIFSLYGDTPEQVTLNYTDNTLRFEFSASNYQLGDNMRFQYMLSGFENDWSAWGTDTRKEYTNLSEGTYTMKVRTLVDGEPSEAATFKFTITPPWYRTWWAYLLGVLLIVLIIYGAIVVRSKQLQLEKHRLEEQVAERTSELKKSQDQLVEQQKLASLGQLTAGIAHELKNPLNFVNNFAELSKDLLDELQEELDKAGDKLEPDDKDYIEEIMQDLSHNVVKINEHGKRADNIMKGMLMHSRSQSGEKEEVDLPDLLNDNIKLAYHGFRSKNSGEQVTIDTDFDPSIKTIKIIRQDVARVILNIVNNAIYAATKKKEKEGDEFEPTVAVSCKPFGSNMVEIRIRDNGTGISEENLKKIFNPFFTTKPTGEGTGLGLSISHDIIVKNHQGTMNVESKEGVYTEFIIQLPINSAA